MTQIGATPGGPVPPAARPAACLRPHRGAMILVFGILGYFCCFLFGVAAWVMANRDLREMAAGRMDPAGRTLTEAGKIVGIVAVAIKAAALLVALLILACVLIFSLLAASAAGGHACCF